MRPPIDPTARLEEGVIGRAGRRHRPRGPDRAREHGSRRARVIGLRVTIGRDCYIGAVATVTHALVGDRVIIHAGVRIGQDGFGFAMGPGGHLKVPQIGRVIIQDDVEIGANSCIDRGALKDTMIGEGTKIDNLVQIGHNVVIGRHCVIVGHVRHLGFDRARRFVVMGGQSGTVGHIKIGDRRAGWRRLAPEGRRAAGRAHGRHAGDAVDASGPRSWPLLKRLAQRKGDPATASEGWYDGGGR